MRGVGVLNAAGVPAFSWNFGRFHGTEPSRVDRSIGLGNSDALRPCIGKSLIGRFDAVRQLFRAVAVLESLLEAGFDLVPILLVDARDGAGAFFEKGKGVFWGQLELGAS